MFTVPASVVSAKKGNSQAVYAVLPAARNFPSAYFCAMYGDLWCTVYDLAMCLCHYEGGVATGSKSFKDILKIGCVTCHLF